MKISFVMNYHNELLSLLMRSIYTLLSSVPRHNFHELILVDDGSDLQKYRKLFNHNLVPSSNNLTALQKRILPPTAININTPADDLNEVEALVSTLMLKVRYVRFNDSKGLIFCRRYASEIATGDVSAIIFHL